jgi:hypothetical protein
MPTTCSSAKGGEAIERSEIKVGLSKAAAARHFDMKIA